MRRRLSHAGRLVASYPELAAVLVAAALGLAVQAPLAWVAAHDGIDTLLAILVFATGITVEPAALRRLSRSWYPVLAALATGIVALPALSWAASHLVAAGPLRDGVIVVGLAPCEIASVATTAMAGADVTLAAGILIGSTLTTVALAGPILILETGRAGIHPGHIVANLAVVVALPLAAGLLLRARWSAPAGVARTANTTAMVAVACLVALTAAEVHLSTSYLPVALALVVFLVGSAGLGRLLGGRTRARSATALLLTTSMRDFAIAAALATAAFGVAAAAPLGLYGIFVLVWGTAAAGHLRRHPLGHTKPTHRG